MSTVSYDLLVIGGGPGGYVAAIRAAQLGLKTACIEQAPALGGTCLNVGCIPSKALLESSHHFWRAQHEFAEHGITCGKIQLDLQKMLHRKNEVVQGITAGVAFLFQKNKVDWIRGTGSLVETGVVEVQPVSGTPVRYQARQILLATGSCPIEIPIAKFDHTQIVDSTDALQFTQVPKHLIVIGGGVIGLELGSVWGRLGAKVTVVEALDGILGVTDTQTAAFLQKQLIKQGMSFHLATKLEQATVKGNTVIARCKKGSESIEIEGDKLLVAVGRRAYTHGLGIEKLGIALDPAGRIPVDAHFTTTIPGVFAIGDVIAGPMLAHKAEEEGVAVAEFLAGKKSHVNYEALPSIIYTWPEVATVGKSEEQLKKEGTPYRVGKFYFKANGRAKAMGDAEGVAKLLAHRDTDRLLGAHLVGPWASEMIAEIAMAFEFGASAEDVARAVHAHPTLAEIWKEAALAVDQRSLHS